MNFILRSNAIFKSKFQLVVVACIGMLGCGRIGFETFDSDASSDSAIDIPDGGSNTDIDIDTDSDADTDSDSDSDTDTDTDSDADSDSDTDTDGSSPPVLVASDPADDSVNVPPTTNITLTYSKDIEPGTGSITVHRADGSVFETLPIADAQIDVSGNTVAVDIERVLSGGRDYYVTLDAGAVVDSDGAEAAAISDPTELNFETRSSAGPGPTVADLILWLDADDPVHFALTDGVSGWFDRSGTDHHAAAPPGAEPVLISNAMNGRQVVRFNGVTQHLISASYPALLRYDVFVVWQSPVAGPTDRITEILRRGSVGPGPDTTNLVLEHGHYVDGLRHAGTASFAGSFPRTQFAAPLAGQKYLWNMTWDDVASDITLRTDTAISDMITVSNDIDTGNPELGIGAAPGPERFFTGDIAEVLIYDAPLSDTERSLVEDYLNTKWDLGY